MLVVGIAGQVRPHANERFEIHALASQAGAISVASAERSLRGENGVGFVEAVDSGQTERNIGERRAVLHGLDGSVTRGELSTSARAEPSVALFEEQSSSFLIVGASRSAHPKE